MERVQKKEETVVFKDEMDVERDNGEEDELSRLLSQMLSHL